MTFKGMKWGLPTISLCLLILGVCGGVFGAEGELLTFKPHAEPLKYSLNIKTHSDLETNWRTYETKRGVAVKHEDMLSLTQSVKETGDGLLDIALTVDEINLIPHGPSIGAQYKREQIVGNTQHIKVNLLGKVEAANGLPHFASQHYYFRGHDGPPLDMYRVMPMIYPRFPLQILKAGSRWEAKDTITVAAAEIPPMGGVAALAYDLEHKTKRRIKYTLVGFEERKGYRTAHIAFEAKYGFEASCITTYRGIYSEGSGEDKGEFYFAPKEGIVVEATIKSRAVENKSSDGQTTTMWLDPKTMIFLDLVDGQRTVPLKWRSEKTISLELAN
ncbi:hypothetical protein N9174_02365 [bacterium]|nr:hypothetical protein [bacterium]